MKTSPTKVGIKYQQEKKYKKAKKCFEQALIERPDNISALVNLGVVLHHLNQTSKGLSYIEKAMALQPKNPDILYNKAELLRMSGDYQHAITYYRAVEKLQEPSASHLFNIGRCLEGVKQYHDAIVCYTQAYELSQDSKFAYQAGRLLLFLKEFLLAKRCFEKIVEKNPDAADAYFYLGMTQHTNHDEEAKQFFEKALALDPNHKKARVFLFHTKLLLCEWENYEDELIVVVNIVKKEINHNKLTINPFAAMILNTGPVLPYKITSFITSGFKTEAKNNHYIFDKRDRNKRLKIGYLSKDVEGHPVTHLAYNLFQSHDKSTVESFLYSTGRVVKDDPYRNHWVQTCDHFTECNHLGDYEVADKIYNDQIDILVDLSGHTGSRELSIMAMMPAPIQVNYLGYPGTSGADYIDYIIADKTVVPENEWQYYSEKPVLMPVTFIITDDEQKISKVKTSLSEHDLPSDKFILCSFNSSYKQDPTVFRIWMEIMHQCENTVLWLAAKNETVKHNLTKEAIANGIASDRLIFSKRVDSKAAHLERLSHAHLCVDSFVFNAITTCVDALWAGVPLITKTGNSYHARGSTSILQAIGLNELVTTTEREYQDKIIHFIKHKDEYTAIRDKLIRNRTTTPLFNTRGFVRNLEKAYQTMWQRYQEDQPLELIDVSTAD